MAKSTLSGFLMIECAVLDVNWLWVKVREQPNSREAELIRTICSIYYRRRRLVYGAKSFAHSARVEDSAFDELTLLGYFPDRKEPNARTRT